jgi:sigma-B regulation protein RsbQ
MNSTILQRNNVNIVGDGIDTIIFAHGFGTDQSAWHGVAEAYKNTHRLVLYDNTGSGKTNPQYYSPNRYNSLHAYTEDLLEICDVLNLHKCILVAHSVSGMIGILAGIKEPERFEKIVVVGASPRYLNDDNYVGGFEQNDLDGFYSTMETNYFAWVSGFAPMAMGNEDRPELAESFAASLSSIRPDIAQSVARTIFQSDHRDDIRKLKHNTLIIQSSNDIAVPQEVGQYLHDHIPNSKLLNITAKGHLPHISEPQQVIDAIQSFI